MINLTHSVLHRYATTFYITKQKQDKNKYQNCIHIHCLFQQYLTIWMCRCVYFLNVWYAMSTRVRTSQSVVVYWKNVFTINENHVLCSKNNCSCHYKLNTFNIMMLIFICLALYYVELDRLIVCCLCLCMITCKAK